jgi:hypothetical protein
MNVCEDGIKAGVLPYMSIRIFEGKFWESHHWWRLARSGRGHNDTVSFVYTSIVTLPSNY